MSQDAKAAGILFYDLPEGLDYGRLDPLIREVCRDINRSGWVWTGESCQGHPDATYPMVWAGNVRPMLRLIVRQADYGSMLNLLLAACAGGYGDPGDRFEGLPVGLELYEAERKGGWVSLLCYGRASTAWERDHAIACYAKFARSLDTFDPRTQVGLK